MNTDKYVLLLEYVEFNQYIDAMLVLGYKTTVTFRLGLQVLKQTLDQISEM